MQLTATLKDASGNTLSGRTVTWSSSNTSVATVSSSGLVSAVTPGSATVTAASEGKTGTASITVTAPTGGSQFRHVFVVTEENTDYAGVIGSSSMPYSNKFVPGTSTKFGKGMVIIVFLWDCAESFKGSNPVSSQWSLLGNASDCSQGISGSVDRVHLFTVAPFTVYEGTIGSACPGNQGATVCGYWGGLFGSPDACQSCALSLTNTAVMVPDN